MKNCVPFVKNKDKALACRRRYALQILGSAAADAVINLRISLVQIIF